MLLFVFVCAESYAQPRHDRVEALRIDFLTRESGITEAEARKLWPVYNEYYDKVRMVRKELRRISMSYNGSLTDNEVKLLFEREQQARKAEAELHVLYSGKMREIIGYRKYLKLRIAEEKFRAELLRKIRKGAGAESR